MKPTEQYNDTLAQFVQTMRTPQVKSCYLYGSMARDDIKPGQSDIDFWVFLDDEVFENKIAFRDVFETMVQAAKDLQESGLPIVHAFCYYAVGEAGWLPAALVPNLQSDVSSKLVIGDDLREQMGSTKASLYTHRTSYFTEMRQKMFHPLTPYLAKETYSEYEVAHILGALKYVKYLAEAACAALLMYPGELEAIPTLSETFPELDIHVIDEIEQYRMQYNHDRDHEKLHTMLLQALQFVESVHHNIRSYKS